MKKYENWGALSFEDFVEKYNKDESSISSEVITDKQTGKNIIE